VKPGLFILTGVSGVGKTTALRRLSRELPGNSYAYHDMDDDGVPDGANERWRQDRVDSWLRDAKENASQGRSTVVSGTLFPEDVQARPSRTAASRLQFCLLEANDDALLARLGCRFSTPREEAELARILNLSPAEFVRRTLSFRAELRRHFEASSCDWISFDTSAVTEKETASFIRSWLESAA
jgi:hypothetical protein